MGELLINKSERYMFKEGTWTECYTKMGAHPDVVEGIKGYRFTVWAPGVKSVHVIG